MGFWKNISDWIRFLFVIDFLKDLFGFSSDDTNVSNLGNSNINSDMVHDDMDDLDRWCAGSYDHYTDYDIDHDMANCDMTGMYGDDFIDDDAWGCGDFD